MPTRLYYKQRDPNGQGRGPGYYYHRGNGIYSKYSEERDAKIQAKNYKVHKVGLPIKSKIKHTGDGRFRV